MNADQLKECREALRPCYCGGVPHLIHVSKYDQPSMDDYWQVGCHHIGKSALLVQADTAEMAAEEWNALQSARLPNPQPVVSMWDLQQVGWIDDSGTTYDMGKDVEFSEKYALDRSWKPIYVAPQAPQIEGVVEALKDTTAWVEAFHCQCDPETGNAPCSRCFIVERNNKALKAVRG